MKSLQTNIKVGDEIICINDFACESEVHRRNNKRLLTIKKDEKYKVKSMGYSYDITQCKQQNPVNTPGHCANKQILVFMKPGRHYVGKL